MKPLVEKLRHHQLARAKAIISLSNIQAIQGIPKGCTINVELGIANPLETLIRAWKATLSQCSQALSQLLKTITAEPLISSLRSSRYHIR